MKAARFPELLLRNRFSDFDQLSQQIRGFGLDWIQLDQGPVTAKLQQIALPSTILTRFHVNRKYHQRGSSSPGMRTFALISPDSPPVSWGRDDSSGCRLVVFPTEEDFRFVSQPGFAGDTITISEQALRHAAKLSKIDDRSEHLPGQAFVAVDPQQHAQLRGLLTSIHAAACTAGSSGTPRDIEFLIASALLEMIEQPGRQALVRSSPQIRRQVLRRALAYIEQHAGAAPLIEDLCRAARTSWRTLDYAFREHFEMTPKQYLNARRLVGVRRDLLRAAPGSTVGEIAARWGFGHAGWFATGYRKHFGELPSATLERQRRAR